MSSHLPIDFQALFDCSPNSYMVLDRQLRFVAVNPAYTRVTGKAAAELLGRNVFEVFPNDPADPDNDSARQLRQSFERVLTQRAPDTLALIAYRVPRGDGSAEDAEVRYWSATHLPLFDAAGEVAYILQHTVDVTELQNLKTAIRDAAASKSLAGHQLEAGVLMRAQIVQQANWSLDAERQHLRRLFEQTPGFVCFLRGREHVFEIANKAYYQVVGHRRIIGKPIREALPELAGQSFYELLDRVLESGVPYVGTEVRALLQREPGGPLEELFVDFVYQPIVGADGTVTGIFVQGVDVTERKHAQDELRRYRERLEELVRERTRALEDSETERRQAEAELRQAQKMEALGKLTGGVAHDFNNLLQVIRGNLELLQRELPSNPRVEQRLRTASGAVDRGSRLVSHLLAFARRQPLTPVVVNLSGLISGMDELLRRAMGEDVEIQLRVPHQPWNTFVDPNQLENVILNLALNARDAMSGHGTLSLAVEHLVVEAPSTTRHRELAPGEYVRLSVTDTGCGMSPEVVERAFEPFFTTKGAARGTGLGLSMVYGFVKQSGGHVELESAPGRGTTFRLYLPRARQEELLVAAQPARDVIERGSETILVVEDDAEVRTTAVELLTHLGYGVLVAADGAAAMAIVRSGVAIDLIFTDVVMPGPLRSVDLAREAVAVLPRVKVLFTSGYDSEDLIVHAGRLDENVSLLSKPYTLEHLARKVRQTLRREPELHAAAAARRLRVLLVDDSDDVRLATAELLVDLGHEVTAVPSAVAALKRAATDPYDVLLTDVRMDGMSGVELARALMQSRPEVALILATGLGRSGVTGAPDVLSRAVVLSKPYDIPELERALAEAVRNHGGPG